MPTSLQGDQQAQGQLTPAEAAQAEVRRLTERQRDLPDLMREAAQRGSFQRVAEFAVGVRADALPGVGSPLHRRPLGY
jgi:hypothetical protein